MLRSPDIISEHYDGRVGLYLRHTRTSADLVEQFALPATLWSARAGEQLYGMATGATIAEAVANWRARFPHYQAERIAA